LIKELTSFYFRYSIDEAAVDADELGCADKEVHLHLPAAAASANDDR